MKVKELSRLHKLKVISGKMVLLAYLTVLAIKKSYQNFLIYAMLIVIAKVSIITLLGHTLCECVCCHSNRDFWGTE